MPMLDLPDFAAALKARSEGLGKDQAVSRTTTYRVPVMPSFRWPRRTASSAA